MGKDTSNFQWEVDGQRSGRNRGICGISDAKYRVYVIDEVGDTEENPREVVDVGSWFEILE